MYAFVDVAREIFGHFQQLHCRTPVTIVLNLEILCKASCELVKKAIYF